MRKHGIVLLNYLNDKLTQCCSLRIESMTGKNIVLNNGVFITGLNECVKFKRRVNSDIYSPYMDLLYDIDIEKRKMTETRLRTILASMGGKICQEKYGDKIKNNLNTGLPWNKNKKGLQIAWSKGLTKNEHDGLLRNSQSKMGNKNPMYGKTMTTDQKNALSEKIKQKILSGEFRPNILNSFLRCGVILNDKKYRSSWEAFFSYINPSYLYEDVKIEYYDGNKTRIYIVDFVDYEKKHLVEIKPSSQIERNKTKINAAKKWAIKNRYTFSIMDENFIIRNKNIINELKSFENIYNNLMKVVKKYEID